MVVAAAHITPRALWFLLAELTPRGPRLLSAECQPPQDHGDQEASIASFQHLLRSWLERLPSPPKVLNIALSVELAALVHAFPLSMLQSEARDAAVDAELQHFLTDYDRHRFSTFVLPSAPTAPEPRYAVAATYSRSEIEVLRAGLPAEVHAATIVPDLFGLPALWRYSYPEWDHQHVVILHAEPPYLDAVLLTAGQFAALRSRSVETAAPETLAIDSAHLIAELPLSQPPHSLVVCGSAVRPELITALQQALAETYSDQAPECRRLNAFRMWLPPSAQRLREYAIRTAHLFWG
ncbi:MAG: hypothetical protein ABDH31_05620, partial [Chlorobiota bacterium]